MEMRVTSESRPNGPPLGGRSWTKAVPTCRAQAAGRAAWGCERVHKAPPPAAAKQTTECCGERAGRPRTPVCRAVGGSMMMHLKRGSSQFLRSRTDGGQDADLSRKLLCGSSTGRYCQHKLSKTASRPRLSDAQRLATCRVPGLACFASRIQARDGRTGRRRRVAARAAGAG